MGVVSYSNMRRALENAAFIFILLVKCLEIYAGGTSPQPLRLSVKIPGSETEATVCAPPGGDKVGLLVFAHGWRVAAEDYLYICTELASAGKPWAVALIETPIEDAAVQPPKLDPLAKHAAVLASELKSQPALKGRLNGQVFLGGHSLGGGTSVLAATSFVNTKISGLFLVAPGLYGATSTGDAVDAAKIDSSIPTVVLAGSSDCVNVPDMPLRAVDTYDKAGSSHKALVVLKDANHCSFANPVKGDCGYDICKQVSPATHQATLLDLFQRFANAASQPSEHWDGFSAYLASEADVQGWQAISTATGAERTSNIQYPLCPAECCPAGLAAWGLCKNETASPDASNSKEL